jgi:CDP-glycerol glycerophosphotransferase (TagB/SpsB family)
VTKHIIVFTITLIVFLSIVTFVNAGSKSCTKQDAIESEKLAANAKNWAQLYRLYQRYHQCDDGAIAEGFSESISVILSEKWDQNDKLLRITQKDKKFEIFILKHIDETVPSDRIQTINKLASDSCSRSAKALCNGICKRINEFQKTK